MKSPLTTHVLDTSLGAPAAGLGVALHRRNGNDWKNLAQGKTDADGRVGDLLAPGQLAPGVYRLVFDTLAYFKSRKVAAFYPVVEVVFEVSDQRHHHVPLLLSPFGYSTYRGS